MGTSFVKSSIAPGTAGTAALFNHAETQADCIVTDLAAGDIPILATALTGTIAAARLPNKYATIYLSAAGGKPRTTGGCAPVAWTEMSTYKQMIATLDFDTGTDEYCQWPEFSLPGGYTGGDIYALPYWTAASGSGTVCWSICGRSYANDEALDQAFGSAATSTDTLITANDVHIGPSATVTLGGTPAAGELCIIQCMRDVSEDTLGVDARLLGILIEYPTAYGD
jgi:hypothetical protein